MIQWDKNGIPWNLTNVQEHIAYSKMRHQLKNKRHYPWLKRGMISCDCTAMQCPCIIKLQRRETCLKNLTDIEIFYLKGEPLAE